MRWRERLGACLALMLAACAPVLAPPGPAPAPPQLVADRFLTRDGLTLPVHRWGTDVPLAVLVALHGFNDYGHAFAMPGPWWAERGIITYAPDQRGFGSAPHRGLWPGTNVMTVDLRDLVAAAQARHPGLPVFVLGESMGGAVALAALAGTEPPAADGFILVAPAVWGWRHLPWSHAAALWTTAHLAPGLAVTGRGLGFMPSDNIPMLRAFAADPQVIKETRTDAVHGLVSLMSAADRAVPRLPARTLVLTGAKDEIVPPGPLADAIARLPAGVRHVQYAEGWHMLLRDLQRERVWADVAEFVLGAAASMRPEIDTAVAGQKQLVDRES